MKPLSSAQKFLKEELQIIKQMESRQDDRVRQEQFDTTARSTNKNTTPCFYCKGWDTYQNTVVKFPCEINDFISRRRGNCATTSGS